MINPVSVFFSNHFGEGCLVLLQTVLVLGGQRLDSGLDSDALVTTLSGYWNLLSNDLTGTLMSNTLCLELLLLKVKESEGIFLP